MPMITGPDGRKYWSDTRVPYQKNLVESREIYQPGIGMVTGNFPVPDDKQDYIDEFNDPVTPEQQIAAALSKRLDANDKNRKRKR